jgi:hypothetical protein
MKRIFSKSKQPIHVNKTQRNELCKCGSGKKAKNCCGANTKYYSKVKIKKSSNLEVSLLFIGEIEKVALNITLLTLRMDGKEYSLLDLLIDKANKICKLKGLFMKKELKFKI